MLIAKQTLFKYIH